MRDPFGYGYPAGTENDPDAPWNQLDEDEEYCHHCGKRLPDEDKAWVEDGLCSQKCWSEY